MKVYLAIVFCFLSARSVGQNPTSDSFIGKWGICYSLDKLDTACRSPFNFFVFKQNSLYQGRDIILSDKKVPMTGTWTYQRDTVFIYSSYKGPEGEARMDNLIIKPVFISKDLFYSKIYDTSENVGHYVYFTYRRLE